MVRKQWLRLALALKESSLRDATRRAAGGSGTRLGRWLAAAALMALAALSFGGQEWRTAAGVALAVMAICAWRDKRQDDLDWDSKEKARENEHRAWQEAREAAAIHESAEIGGDCPKAKKGSGGPKRL